MNRNYFQNPIVNIIVATDINGAIGKDNKLLFNLPNDMKRFRELTMHHPVIMGRKTFFSIGKLLPNRTNIILTKDDTFNWCETIEADGGFVVTSIEEALKVAKETISIVSSFYPQIFVIGGAEIYKQFLDKDLVDCVYLTKVLTKVKDADSFFPIDDFDFYKLKWYTSSWESFEADDKHLFDYVFSTYVLTEQYLEQLKEV